MYSDVKAFPELFAPLELVLKSLRPQDKPTISKELQKNHCNLLESLVKYSTIIKTNRESLQWRKNVKAAIDTKNPKFQADYTFKKDLDPDENRAKLKQLTRQSKRETKAAMRELRRDSDYIDQLSYAEQNDKKDRLKAERVKNFGWMEEQQASVNMQVRKGGELVTGGGSAVAKKARVKR
jgi:nucleolar protein 14